MRRGQERSKHYWWAAGSLSLDLRPFIGWMTDRTGTENLCDFDAARNGHPSNCFASEADRLREDCPPPFIAAVSSSAGRLDGCIDRVRRVKNLLPRHDDGGPFSWDGSGPGPSPATLIVGRPRISSQAGDDDEGFESSDNGRTSSERAASPGTKSAGCTIPFRGEKLTCSNVHLEHRPCTFFGRQRGRDVGI